MMLQLRFARLADGLAEGRLHLPQSLGAVEIPVGNELNFEIEVKEKAKESAVKRSIEIELEWYGRSPERGVIFQTRIGIITRRDFFPDPEQDWDNRALTLCYGGGASE